MKLNLGKIGNGADIFVNCSASRTRHGFAHHAKTIMPDGSEIAKTVHYLNRTWESYRFQTVLHCLCEDIAVRLYGVPSSRSLYKAKKWENAREYARSLKNAVDKDCRYW